MRYVVQTHSENGWAGLESFAMRSDADEAAYLVNQTGLSARVMDTEPLTEEE